MGQPVFSMTSENPLPRLHRRRDESTKFKNIAKDRRIYYRLSFFDQKVLSAKMPFENMLHTDDIAKVQRNAGNCRT